MPPDAAIATRDLTVEYGDVTAVDALSLTVPRESVYGFLGPNGSGKSTTIAALLGYLTPDAGTVDLFGRGAGSDPAIRQDVGVVPEDTALYPRLTARDHLRFAARSKDVAVDADAILDRVGLADAADRRAGGYSTGMAKRLLLAMALVGAPDLLVLDEPTSGLDPNGARMVREVVRSERDRGATVFFSSHVMGQVEAVCDTIAIIDDGALVAEDDVDALERDTVGGEQLRVDCEDPDAALDRIRDLDAVTGAAVDEGAVTATCRDGAAKLAALDAVRDATTVTDFTTTAHALDDVFQELTDVSRDADAPEEGTERGSGVEGEG